MSGIIKLMLSAAVILALCGRVCGQELRLYIWSEYIDPAIVRDFEKEFNCRVFIDLYESNEEMAAKLLAGGISQYDIVVPSGYAVKSMLKQKLLMKLDKSKIPNLKNIDPQFAGVPSDPDGDYSVAYQWGTVGIMYHTERVRDFRPSWQMVLGNNPHGAFLLMDSTREMIGSALIFMGKNPNTTDKNDISAAARLLTQTKRNRDFRGFEGGIGGKNQVIAGAAAIAVTYNGDAVRGISDNPKAAFVNPEEGGLIWLDSMAVTARAPNPDLAHKFINYILDPRVGAKLSNYNRYATPNLAALEFICPEDLRNPAIYPTAATRSKLHFLDDLGRDNRIYDEAWTAVKSR